MNKFGIPAELGTTYDDHELKVDIWIQIPGLIPIGIQVKFTDNPEREDKTIKFIEERGFKEVKRPNPNSQSVLGKYSGQTFHFHSIRPQHELKQLFEQSEKMKLSPSDALLAKRGPATLRTMFFDIIKETERLKDKPAGKVVKQKIMQALQQISGN